MSISPATEKVSPAKTLRGFHVPRELVDSIKKQEEARKREMEERMMAVQKCLVQKPADEKGKAELNAAIRWLGEKAGWMDDAHKLGAFFPIARLAEEGCGCVDPLEAGLAMSAIAGKLDILNAIFDIMRENLITKMKSVTEREIVSGMNEIGYYVMLVAALGEPKAVRLVLFWEKMGMVSDAADRIASVRLEMVEGIRKDIEAGAKASLQR